MPIIEIKLGDILFDPKVQKYCVNSNFKCPSYGHSWACPPEAPYLEQEVSKYHRFFLIYVKFNLIEYIQDVKAKYPKRSEKRIKNAFFMNNLLRDKLEQEINNFIEEDQILSEKKLVLW
ncbi:MAG: hypothetical protein KAV01_12405, partial [Candidatus Lokiarchaeota archaeon]|nr:hypothetical protein [Candidatus Lokiarchaeota archaeon]